MKYKIINIYAGFQNCYNDMPWRMFHGTDCIGSFRTRAAAREFIKASKSSITL